MITRARLGYCGTAALVLAALAAATPVHAAAVSPLGERGYGVIPAPRQVALAADDLRLPAEWRLELGPGVQAGDVAVETLEEELSSRFGLRRGGAGLVIRLAITPGVVKTGGDEGYRVAIDPGRISIEGNGASGLFYGVETLAQLVRVRAGSAWAPTGVITDWPDLPQRHIYWDDAHHLERLPELKRAIRQAAFFKINGFALKLEGHFQFRSAPAVVEPYALTPAEYQELTDYGLRYHVQLIPYLDAPAHVAFLLKHPEYAKYRAFPDSNYEICAVNPDATKLMQGMFQDLLDANRGGKFVYLSTDEAYYIGMANNAGCDEKAAAQRAGSRGKLLASFVQSIAEPMHRQGRQVIFWGEYPLETDDIASLPSYLVNGEVYGPAFDPLYKKRGIRQMIYTHMHGEETRFFPDYFELPNALRVHPVPPRLDRVRGGFRAISFNPARRYADLIGAVVAGWGDTGLHPETFWLGYATVTAAAWNSGNPAEEEASATFYRVYYGDGAREMSRVYQLMSQQTHFWLDSWEWGPSSRKPLFGDSTGPFTPRRPVKDQILALPDLEAPRAWLDRNARLVDLANVHLAANDELLGLLTENLGTVERNRYSLELYVALARVFRHNLQTISDIGRVSSLLDEASKASGAKPALEALDRALETVRQIRARRNAAYRDLVAAFEKTWFPRVRQANGRAFLHELDDVKDHVGDRTVDLRYTIERELQLPLGEFAESIRARRNRLAQAAGAPPDDRVFDWRDMTDVAVAGGSAGE